MKPSANIPVLTIILVSLAVGFLFQFITVSNAKKAKKLKHGNEFIVRNPQAFIWVGYINVIFLVSFYRFA